MSNSNESSSSGGIGLAGGIFLVFLILKLAEIGAVAKWSWWWVTSPLWIPVLIAIAIFLVIGIGWVLLKIYNSTFNRKKYAEFKKVMADREERNKKPVSRWQQKLKELHERNLADNN